MKCGEPKPGSSYATCNNKLKHRDDHTYLGDRWPRVRLAEPDEDIDVLLSRAAREAGAWGAEERSFPIVVTETIVRVIWVDAENEDQALAYWGEDPTDLPSDGEVLDGSFEFERPDKWQRKAAFKATRFESKIGPLVPCPDCKAEAFCREWMHNPMRKCHGPIEWRETNSSNPRFQWRREYQVTPVGGARQAVTA
ncbi:hypothetical protein DMH25_08345 [Streptomyces sp. WAC 01325]|uniref:hypothetical protein n=1 Tax=Streptomyces sp. WAC 01325 TaxID=2203202 RepID=UPI000F8779D2|nr:hypothetical protein [Streptomyces sp. WAC 01325]RSN13787.1 hypothetical protein DMH25_08345 [Streptomyces sp. WAC 01325]